MVSRGRFVILLVLGAFIAGACARGPQPIAYGEAECGFCRMGIDDPRFGAELITATGKVHTFDSIECLASFYLQERTVAEPRALLVTDSRTPGRLIPVGDARFVRGSGIHSPMGLGLMALAKDADPERRAHESGGELLEWRDIVALVEREQQRQPSAEAAEIATAGPAPPAVGSGDTVVVSPSGAHRTVASGVAAATPGGTVIVEPGVYREPTITLDRPVTLLGRGAAILDGEGARTIMLITADDVTVRGLRFRDVGASMTEDRAAIRIAGAADCVIENNVIDDAFFGIYLAKVERCRIAGNELRGTPTTEATAGNGIHLWSSRGIEIADNRIAGHRDGIYFEFVHDSRITGNLSERNLRYGLHFMYSDGCRYERNVFRDNTAGVAVMYTRAVEMIDNRFERNWGSAAYGILLKEIADSRIEGNVFQGNSTGLLADGANRLVAHRNRFVENGWAVRLMASTQDARFSANDFVGNTFDVATNSRSASSRFDGNYWDGYRGYDLDRDGVGDVPHRPVRLFSLIVERNEPSLILLRGVFVELLDAAERVLPVLTPASLADARPSMRPIQ